MVKLERRRSMLDLRVLQRIVKQATDVAHVASQHASKIVWKPRLGPSG